MTSDEDIAHEYFSEAEGRSSSTYRELLAVCGCLQAFILRCAGRFVVLQVDAQNLLWIVNRGSRTLPLNQLARDLFWFGLKHKMAITVEWVPREQNAFADEISKLLIPDDWSLSRVFFVLLDARWGPHSCDLFASGDNNLCVKLYSLH